MDPGGIMTKFWTLMATVAVLGLCRPASAETIPAAGQTITTADARFAAPADWTLERADKVVRLIAPEGDLRMTLVDVGPAKDAAAAVAAAYALAEPGFARKLRLSTPMPAREGWDEIVNFDYETSPNEKRSIVATPYRAGASWLVLLGDGSWATFNKRSGAINTFFDSIRPAKYVKESFAGRVPHKLDPARIALIKDFVADSMRQLGIPGAGVAFIQDGKIVDEGGIGVRKLGRPEKVDVNTRFMIASNTKGMTTLLLAKLVDQGKLRWDQPVVDAYPAFRLGSDDVTKAIRIRHLVCACTGMPRQDLEWIMTGDLKTPASRVFDIMKTMQPTSKFGEVYQYSNILAAAAGYVAAHVAYPTMEMGAGYDRAMREMIWRPLGMTATTFDFGEALRGNVASPHADDVDGRPSAGAWSLNDSIYFGRPAGGAWSTTHDMALFALNELNEGRLATGKQLVSPANLLERRFRGVPYAEGTTYGMGLENNERYGVRVVHHGGSMAGYKSDWLVIPEAGIGAVLLTNSDNGRPLLAGFLRRILEVVYDGKPEAAGDIAGVVKSLRADEAEERSHLQVPADPAATARLAPRYTSPDLGTITVRPGKAGPVFDFGSFSSRMVTRKNPDGSTSFVMADPGLVGWPLIVKPGDRFDALVMRDAQHEYVYTPQP